MIKKVLIIVCLMTLICGCNNSSSDAKKNESKAQVLEKIIEEDNYIVLDVRTKDEYESGHVVGALNIEYDKIDEKVDIDKEKTILVYCQSGRRSSIAYDTLKSLGYDAFDLGAYDSINLEKE